MFDDPSDRSSPAAQQAGRMWAAMNIRDDKLWRAHFILLDAEGEPTGAAMNSPFGAAMTAALVGAAT